MAKQKKMEVKEQIETPPQETGENGAATDVARIKQEIAERIQNDEVTEIALAAIDELAERAGELDKIQDELNTTQSQLMRQVAEFQNYRRRTEQEKSRLVDLGRAQVVQPMLDVLDDLARALEAAEQAEQEQDGGPAYQALKQGVDLVFRKFNDELTRLGVEAIEAVGQPFDEHLHEAMMQQPAPDGTEPGTVLHEVQKGYRMGDRVLRHSKVVVAG